MDEFMQDIALLTDADTKAADATDSNKVSLMTIHAAKGLEFPYVYIAGVEENLFPSQMSMNSQAELEEERRLFYVALTRAMTQATVTYAETRFRYGNFNFCEPSRFIDELDPGHINFLMPTGRRSAQKEVTESFSESRKKFIRVEQAASTTVTQGENQPEDQGGFSILDPSSIQINMVVKHQRFGAGTIVDVEGSGQNAKATVLFTGLGKKQLLLKFARLKIVG